MDPTLPTVATLFVNKIDRPIEEVVKVDQTDEGVLAEEFAEYVVTDSIRRQLLEVLRGYDQVGQEQPVDDLGERLVAALHGAVGGDVEDDGVGRPVLGNLLQQDRHLIA